MTIIEFIKRMLSKTPENMDGEWVTQDGENLFTINEEHPFDIDNKKSEMLHKNADNLLLLYKG